MTNEYERVMVGIRQSATTFSDRAIAGRCTQEVQPDLTKAISEANKIASEFRRRADEITFAIEQAKARCVIA